MIETKLSESADRKFLVEIARVWVPVTVGNALLYVFQLLVARRLGPGDYGLVGALLGSLYLAAAFNSAVQAVVAKVVAGSGDQDSRGDVFLARLLRVWGVRGAAFLIPVLLLSVPAAHFLNASSTAPVAVAAIMLYLAAIMPIPQGTLQGRHLFGLLGATFLVHAATRLLFGVVALGMGTGVAGVMWAVTLSTLVTVVLALLWVRPPISLLRAPAGREPIGIHSLLGPAVVGSIAVNVPTSADVILARHYLDPAEAGIYAAASILGKVVVFLPLAISMVLIPRVSAALARGESSAFLLRRGLVYTAAVSGSVAAAFALFPGTFIHYSVGDEYSSATAIVPLYVMAMFFLSMTILFFNFHIASGNGRFVYRLLLPATVIQLGAITLMHGSARQLTLAMFATNAALAVASFAVTRNLFRDHAGAMKVPTPSRHRLGTLKSSPAHTDYPQQG